MPVMIASTAMVTPAPIPALVPVLMPVGPLICACVAGVYDDEDDDNDGENDDENDDDVGAEVGAAVIGGATLLTAVNGGLENTCGDAEEGADVVAVGRKPGAQITLSPRAVGRRA